MPIRATSAKGDIHAYELDERGWGELKADYRRLNLLMPCCAVAAIPKTSSRGNYFFAHARRGECTTADESAEHLACKTIIARAAKAAGWSVTTEKPGKCPQGEEWVADVFCEREAARIALEIQMSPQTNAETDRRQERYKASGVRAAWFFGPRARKGPLPVKKATPAFALQPFKLDEVPGLEGFEVGLEEFVAALLGGKVTWSVPVHSRPHLVEYVLDTCWSCRRAIKQVLEHLRGGDTLKDPELKPEDFYEGRWDPAPNTVANLSKRLEAVAHDITNEELGAVNLNQVGRLDMVRGKSTRFPFCNVCRYCGALQNNVHVTERVLASQRRERAEDGDWMLPERNESEPEDDRESVFGIATIAREIEGPGFWVCLTS